MDLLSLFLIAVGLSMDAFAVSVCKGLATPKYKLKYSMICGAWFGGFQALMPAVGYLLGVNFKKYITAIRNNDRRSIFQILSRIIIHSMNMPLLV
jgi:manganese efflux pump family protein